MTEPGKNHSQQKSFQLTNIYIYIYICDLYVHSEIAFDQTQSM